MRATLFALFLTVTCMVSVALARPFGTRESILSGHCFNSTIADDDVLTGLRQTYVDYNQKKRYVMV